MGKWGEGGELCNVKRFIEDTCANACMFCHGCEEQLHARDATNNLEASREASIITAHNT